MNENDEKKDDGYDSYPGASRATLAVLIVVILIWAFYDYYKTGSTGFQWMLISIAAVVFTISSSYLKRKNSKKSGK